ncbi:MAG TPA: HD domain-containing protein [Gemmatimonadales bacterium]|nr:HD domain-containing protein [Gemmatimonadales bacterium]
MITLPPWAEVDARRRAHIERVATLLASWAEAMRVSAAERNRWLKGAYLHDALKDARLSTRIAHGPAAADRAAAEGETDQGVLDAVRYHTIGYARWDNVGRMLYLADFLEPGRTGNARTRRELAARVPREHLIVLREVARLRIDGVLTAHWPLLPETVEFWNALVSS